MIKKITAGLLAALLFTGCAGSTGWRFEIGGLSQELSRKKLEVA